MKRLNLRVKPLHLYELGRWLAFSVTPAKEKVTVILTHRVLRKDDCHLARGKSNKDFQNSTKDFEKSTKEF